MESYGSPTYNARKLGKVAVELIDVNIPAMIEQTVIEAGYDAVLDSIPKCELVKYMQELGYEVKEDE